MTVPVIVPVGVITNLYVLPLVVLKLNFGLIILVEVPSLVELYALPFI